MSVRPRLSNYQILFGIRHSSGIHNTLLIRPNIFNLIKFDLCQGFYNCHVCSQLFRKPHSMRVSDVKNHICVSEPGDGGGNSEGRYG